MDRNRELQSPPQFAVLRWHVLFWMQRDHKLQVRSGCCGMCTWKSWYNLTYSYIFNSLHFLVSKQVLYDAIKLHYNFIITWWVDKPFNQPASTTTCKFLYLPSHSSLYNILKHFFYLHIRTSTPAYIHFNNLPHTQHNTITQHFFAFAPPTLPHPTSKKGLDKIQSVHWVRGSQYPIPHTFTNK